VSTKGHKLDRKVWQTSLKNCWAVPALGRWGASAAVDLRQCVEACMDVSDEETGRLAFRSTR